MTKSDFRTIKNAHDIIDRLTDSEQFKNRQMHMSLHAALGSSMDELGMLVMVVEENPQVFVHNFWNNELADHVQKEVLAKDRPLNAVVEQQWHGEYSLKIDGDNVVDDWEYQNYLTEEEAWEDVRELIKLGFQIPNPDEDAE